MLYRKAQEKIINLINECQDSLLDLGSRQIGKTFLINETLKQYGCDFVVFNLIEQPEVVEVLKTTVNKDINQFLAQLTLLTKHNFIKGKTIIFLMKFKNIKKF